MVRILSNFDTQFDDQCVNEAIDEFDKKHICFIRRDRIYILIKIIIPTLVRLIFSMILIALAYWSALWKALWYAFQVFVWIVVCATWIILLWKVTNKLIDYYMDFTIINPRQITSYDQSWIFTRNERSLDISKIKSVRIEKKWIFRSLFNFGTIVFFAEWDEHNWDIKLNYITDPNKLRKRLQEIINIDIY